tara:strand:- start:63 stop:557 length:495 start_codon:yes stop_codon:yes gene_type:complete
MNEKIKDGLHTEWYDNGRKEKEGTYKNGKKDGKWTTYYENGQIHFELNYKDYTTSYDSVRKKLIVHGKRYVINVWSKDGELLVKDGNGKWTSYYENGEIERERNYKDGKEDGKWTSYYENGHLMHEENYKDGELDGKKTSYYSAGQIEKVEEYKDGTLLKETKF